MRLARAHCRTKIRSIKSARWDYGHRRVQRIQDLYKVLYNNAPDIDWLQSSLDLIDDANVKLPCPDGLAIASTFVTQTEHQATHLKDVNARLLDTLHCRDLESDEKYAELNTSLVTLVLQYVHIANVGNIGRSLRELPMHTTA